MLLQKQTGILAQPGRHTHCLRQPSPWQHRRSATCSVAAGEKKKESTLSNLESLLGSRDEDSKSPQEGEGLIEWWRIKPSQSAPPRRSFMSPGPSGRFLMSEDFMGELRVGRKTELGEQLEVPKVQPVLSFVLFLMNFSCAVTYMNVEAMQGPDGGREYLLGICNSLRGLEGGLPGLLHPLISCFQAPGPWELGLALWALAVVGPRIEASIGSLTFLAVYLMSGYSAGLTSCMLQQVQLWAGAPFVNPADATCGASASLLGIVGAMAVYHARNSHLEGLRYGSESEGLQDEEHRSSDAAAADMFGIESGFGSESGGESSVGGGSGAGVDRLASNLGASSSSSSSSSSTNSTGVGSNSSSGSTAPRSLEEQQQRQQDWQRRQRQLLFYLNTGVVAVGSVALALLQREGPQEGIAPVSLLPTLVGGLTGWLLTSGMGPRFYVQREAQIPEGAMFVPENTREMAMCLDRTSGLQRGLVASAATAGLLVFAQCIRFVHGLQ